MHWQRPACYPRILRRILDAGRTKLRTHSRSLVGPIISAWAKAALQLARSGLARSCPSETGFAGIVEHSHERKKMSPYETKRLAYSRQARCACHVGAGMTSGQESHGSEKEKRHVVERVHQGWLDHLMSVETRPSCPRFQHEAMT